MSLISKWNDRKLADYQQELSEIHYREVETMYQEMRGWRHDYRNHIQTLKVLAEEGNLEAVRSYLDELESGLASVEPAVKTGNSMADAILNSKISLARANGISVRVDAQIPVKLSMSELDLCTILGNLFDNAIEASMALPENERMIRVYMDMKNTQLYISFTNLTADGKRNKACDGLFATTKGNGHGLGLVRIDRIIEKLDGYLSRNSEAGAFTTEILIPQL